MGKKMTDQKQQSYAIIESGSKQYRVQQGDIIDVELLGIEAGEAVEFSKVLFRTDGAEMQVGTPTLSDCIVKAEIMGEIRGPKVTAFKYKRRKNYRRKIGHRQDYSRVKITQIGS